MTIQSTQKRPVSPLHELSTAPPPKRVRAGASTQASAREPDDSDTDSHREYRSQVSTYVPESSCSSWSDDASLFSSSPPGNVSVNTSQRAANAPTSLGDAISLVAPEEAFSALAFTPCAYTVDTSSGPSPGGVFLSLASCLGRLLDSTAGLINATRRAKIAGVLAATAMYADTLGQPGMKALVEALPTDDIARLRLLRQQLSHLGCNLLFSPDASRPIASAPDLATLLGPHHDNIQASNSGPQQTTHVHALAAILEGTALHQNDVLKQACADYLEGGESIEEVTDALVDAIGVSASSRSSRAAPTQMLIAQDDVRSRLIADRHQLQESDSNEKLLENVQRLADWLQALGQSAGSLERPMQNLLEACIACHAFNGSAEETEAMRNALNDCVAAAAIAADQNNLGPDLSNPANAGTLDKLAHRYAVLLKRQRHAEDRIVYVVKSFLKDPTARGSALSRRLRIDVNGVSAIRSKLRNHVACNIPRDRLLYLISAALHSNKVEEYTRTCSQMVGDRLANPRALPSWKEMARRYTEKSGGSVYQFLELVGRRDASLLQFIPPDDPFAGVLYAHLFQTNRNYCKSIEDARVDLLRVLVAAELPAEPGETAAEQQPLHGQAARDPQADG